jgi:hypothetical protein
MPYPRIFHFKESQDQPVVEPTPVPATPKEENLILIVEVSKDNSGTWHCDVQNHSNNNPDFDEAHRILLDLATRHLTMNTPAVVTDNPPIEPPQPV